jgi:hypothetical protein
MIIKVDQCFMNMSLQKINGSKLNYISNEQANKWTNELSSLVKVKIFASKKMTMLNNIKSLKNQTQFITNHFLISKNIKT